jgi:hypothetical protein
LPDVARIDNLRQGDFVKLIAPCATARTAERGSLLKPGLSPEAKELD